LAATADGLRQLVFGHGDVHGMLFFVDDDRLHFGRRHRIDDELRGIVVPQHDVDALAVELVRHGLHARAAHADAGAYRIGAAVVRDDGDLGAIARIARRALDLDEALTDFRHFEAKQFDHEFRRRSRYEQLRPALFGAYFVQIAPDTVTGAHRFARYRTVARHVRFGIAAQIQVQAAALDALDDTGDQLANAILVGIDDLRPLGFAHALHDDLFGRLRGDASEFGVFDRLFEEIADLAVGLGIDRIHEADLPVRRFHDDIVSHDFPAAERFVFATMFVDADPRRDVEVRIALLRRRGERSFHRVEDDVFLDAFFIGDGVDDQQ
jgi:hypothetical protein